MKKIILALTVMLSVSIYSQVQQTTWRIDPVHSTIQFTVSHLVISKVTGNFKNFDGVLKTSKDDFNDSDIEFNIDVNSINTENEKRDNHLKSQDFFYAEKYPKIIFKSRSFKKVSENKYKLTGDFTMRDVTKPVELDVVYNGTVKDPWGNQRAGFSITGSVNRFDYNLKWNSLMEAGGAVVGKTVDILCNVEMVRQNKN